MNSLAGLGGVAFVLALGLAWAQERRQESAPVSAEEAKYKETIPGVSKCVLWEDAEKGTYRAFTKFAPGFKVGFHTHPNDIRMVILKGAYIYVTDAGETRVGPNSYFFIPAGTKHASKGDPTEGALFYEESPGKFELNMVESK